MSSKTARLHRRQAARREQYRRLRKAGRVPQHTTAERRHAAAERKHQREAEAHRQWWHDRLSGSLAATVGAAAAGVVIAAPVATDGIGHLYKPYSVASRLYPWVLSSDDGSPDYPHVPEPDRTFYTPLTQRAPPQPASGSGRIRRRGTRGSTRAVTCWATRRRSSYACARGLRPYSRSSVTTGQRFSVPRQERFAPRATTASPAPAAHRAASPAVPRAASPALGAP